MDETKLIEALRSTIIPEKRDQAETYLKSLEKIIGVAPLLLQIVMKPELDTAIRQAAVIYVKNMIIRSWSEPELPNPAIMQFAIHEQDKHVIREHIVEALANAPEPIRLQLTVVVASILQKDFPGKWPTVVDKISFQLNQTDGHAWLGGLITLYKLVKNYEYKRNKEKGPLLDTMKVLLPVCYERLVALMPDPSQESVFLQKLILKIFYALVQFSLNLNLLSKEDFGRWMELVRQILVRPVPEHTLEVDEDERQELVWWKCKKWAVHLMSRIFERYGNPTQSASTYKSFADYYLKTQAPKSVEAIFLLLNDYRQVKYVSPRVLHLSLAYLQSGVSHAFSWKLIRPHMRTLVHDICFPLMCHTDADDELCLDDPVEFIRLKYDIFDELLSPTAAAAALLSASMKRKDELRQCGEFVMQVLNSAESNERQQDGALHMIGTIAPNLLKSKKYKSHLEGMLTTHVLPRLESQHGFLRARSCWVVQTFSEVDFKNQALLGQVVDKLMQRLLHDEALYVKVEAALALQMLLNDQPKVEKLLLPHVKLVILEVLKLLADTHMDDLTTVIQKLVGVYTDQVTIVAIDIAKGLAHAFRVILEDDEGAEDRSITAMSILNTLETVLTFMEEHREIMGSLEGIVLEVIEVVIKNSVMDFYEEVLSLVASLTCIHISENMWKVYAVLYNMFEQDGFDYFTDFMPALHNYITVDTDAFLAVPDRLNVIHLMCKQVLTSEASDEESECHAAKLLEVIVLQCHGRVDHFLRPTAELVFARLTRTIHTSELRTMLLQVMIAGIVTNASLMIQVIQSLQPPDSSQSVLDHFITQWIEDTDCFLGVHDRKLCLLGMCALMELTSRPGIMGEMAPKVLPSCVLLFQGLEKAYQAQAEFAKAETDDESEGDFEEADDGLASDEDEIDETTCSYLEKISKDGDSGNDDAYSDTDSDEDDDCGETDLESYTTPLDGENANMNEYIVFKHTLQTLEQTEPDYYKQLVSLLNEEQMKDIQNILTIADQKYAAQVSQAIEAGGGYKFDVQQVPTSFDFSQ